MTYSNSFLNYPGNKYKIIKSLIHYFPNHVNRFVDLFEGSAVVTENYFGAKYYVANDLNTTLVNLQKYILRVGLNNFKEQVIKIINCYHLSDTFRFGYKFYNLNSQKGLGSFNKLNYLKLRNNYNNKETKYNLNSLLYVLIVYGFNNQIRFNRHKKFNNPVGKRDWNKSMREKLKEFYISCNVKQVKFISKSFQDVNVKASDFIYADPPYLITTAVYNDGSGWNSSSDKRLFQYLDKANELGSKFALSNVFTHKGLINRPLIKWSKKYKVHHIKKSYNSSSYHTKRGKSDEVLITNY